MILIYKNLFDEISRYDGPAVINYNSNKEAWLVNGKLHREGGPAIVIKDKEKKFYYVFGERYDIASYWRYIADNGFFEKIYNRNYNLQMKEEN